MMKQAARNMVEGLRLVVWSIMLLFGIFLGALIMVGVFLAVLLVLLVLI